MSVERELPLETLRIRLEGRLELLERSVEAKERITQALRRWKWRAALAREQGALTAVTALAPEADHVLAELAERMAREGWRAQSEVARFVQRAQWAQGELSVAVSARMARTNRSPTVLEQLAEWEREPVLGAPELTLVLQPGSRFVRFLGLFSIAAGVVVFASGDFGDRAKVAIGAFGLLALGAVGILLLWGARPVMGAVFRSAGRLEVRRGQRWPHLQWSLAVLPGCELRLRRQVSDEGSADYQLEFQLGDGDTVALASRPTLEEAMRVAQRIAHAFKATLRVDLAGGTRRLFISTPPDASPPKEPPAA